MNWKAFVPLAVAIVLGLIAARVAMNVVSDRPAEVAPVATNLTSIVMATGDIPPGTLLTEQHLKIGNVESTNVPVGSFDHPQPLVGRVTKVALAMNQPIIPTLLAESEAGMGIGATLPEGMRAITVEINDVSGVAGFIQPTCRVDVVGTLQDSGKSIAKTVLENIMVLAVGTRTGPAQPVEPGQPVEAARTITLLCTPEEAEKLELATASTRVRLVLRNGEDKSTLSTDGVTLADLRGKSDQGGDPFAPTQGTTTSNTIPSTQPITDLTTAQAKKQWTVEIIRAGAQSTQTFEIEAEKPAIQKPRDPFGPVTSGAEVESR